MSLPQPATVTSQRCPKLLLWQSPESQGPEPVAEGHGSTQRIWVFCPKIKQGRNNDFKCAGASGRNSVVCPCPGLPQQTGAGRLIPKKRQDSGRAVAVPGETVVTLPKSENTPMQQPKGGRAGDPSKDTGGPWPGRDPGRCQHTGKSPELTLAEGPARGSHSSGHSSPSAGRGHQVRGQRLQDPFTLELAAFFPNEQRFPLPSTLSEQTRAAPGLVKSGEAQPHHGDVPSPSQTLKSPFPKQNLSFQRSSAEIGDTECGEPPPPRTARTGRKTPQTLGDFGYVPPAPWLRQGLGSWPQKRC